MSRIILTSGTDAEWFYPRLCIAHQAGTVTASSTDTGYSAAAITTPQTYTAWKPVSMTATIEIDFGSAKTISYMAIYIKNGVASCTIDPEYWTGTGWAPFISTTVSATKGGPYAWMKLTGVSASKVRLVVNGSTAPEIAFFGAGDALKFECGIPPGFAPASLNQDDEFTNTFSEGGQVLGSQKLRSSAKQDIAVDAVSPSWVATNWPSVRALMNTNGMFFAFNPKDAPDELIYGIRGKNAPSASYSSSQYMALSFGIEGPEIEL